MYYYEQAGNLIQTIPPEGVNLVASGDFDDGIWNGTEPAHDQDLITRYQYNTAEQLTAQRTPEAGQTEFIYDKAQRLRFSQNAKQGSDDYSFTKYCTSSN